jgi:uncharacterized protein YndB with AHSA1/START domain
VPTARRSRTIVASVEELWEVIRDPHHLPRWWPRVTRIEDVEADAFTEVMRTAKGKLVRADFRLVEGAEGTHALRWDQQLEGTPFARLLKSAETEVWLTPLATATAPRGAALPTSPAAGARSDAAATETAAATEVTIELRQTLNGFVPRLGGYLVRRAAAGTLEEALNGLERISG